MTNGATGSPYNLKASTTAAHRNREPILAELKGQLRGARRVLELGSGAGVHAEHFARHLPRLVWQPTEQPSQLQALANVPSLPNLRPAIALDITAADWPVEPANAVFLANVLHMLPESAIPGLMRNVSRALCPGGRFLAYGPFNENGTFTGAGNEAFDRRLRRDHPDHGLRDIRALNAAAAAAGFDPADVIAMPADNRLLVWRLAGGRAAAR